MVSRQWAIHYSIDSRPYASQECCYSPTNENAIPKGSLKFSVSSSNVPSGMIGGFASMTATDTSMTVTWYDQAGNSLYTTPEILPRAL